MKFIIIIEYRIHKYNTNQAKLRTFLFWRLKQALDKNISHQLSSKKETKQYKIY
jgi:hypothetical protein